MVAAPAPIDAPVPAEWQAPFTQFLLGMGVQDSETLLKSTKTAKLQGLFAGEVLVFRLEDKSVCEDNICLTVLGKIEDDRFVSHIMFMAGKMLTQGDTFPRLFGRNIPPAYWFMRGSDISDPRIIYLYETPMGWVVVAPP